MFIIKQHMNTEVERIKKMFFLQRIKNELDTLKDSDPRYDYLKNINDQIMATNTKLDDFLIKASNGVYTRDWYRLPDYHKKQKIHEYIFNKYDKDPTTIENKLLDYLKEGKLDKCKQVTYNTKTMKIEKIVISRTETY